MQLIVGTDSTWSLRAWLCAQIVGVDVEVKVIDLSKEERKAELKALSSSGLVPVLRDKQVTIHDSLAIAEYLNELSNGKLYPHAQSERAVARAMCNEMHSGFMCLREQCSFTLETVPPADLTHPGLKQDVERVTAIFSQAQGRFMFEEPGLVDAFYAVLAYRLQTYGIELQGKALDYQRSLLNWSLLNKGIDELRAWQANV